MSAHMIDLTKYVSWFLRKYVWSHTYAYKDALMLIARRLDIVDMAMIYEALTGQQYGDQTIIYLESLTVQSELYKFLRPRANVRHYKIPPNAINDYEYLIENANVNVFDWVLTAVECNNFAPLQYTIAVEHDWASYHIKQLFDAACMVDSVECVNMIIRMCTFVLKCNYVRPRTAPILRELGFTFENDPYGALLCAVGHVEHQYTSGYSIEDLCVAALEHGQYLDWIHAQMRIEEIARTQTDYYHMRSLQWLIKHNAPLDLLDINAFTAQDFIFMLPYMTQTMRASILATSFVAWNVYKLQPFDFCRETFRQKASSKIWKKVYVLRR
jgi:hypothetical protein